MIPRILETADYYVWRNFLDVQTVALLKHNLQISRTATEISEFVEDDIRTTYFGDPMVEQSWAYYSHPAVEGLLHVIKPAFELLFVDRELHPCFTYARIMYKGAKMLKHTDRLSCEYSATCCISQTVEYPIWIEDGTKPKAIVLNPGDVLFYKGTILPHWREEYEGPEHIQVFCHFVDAQGPFSSAKWDCRPALGLGSQFKDYKLMEQLEEIEQCMMSK